MSPNSSPNLVITKFVTKFITKFVTKDLGDLYVLILSRFKTPLYWDQKCV